jgi:hypothetical protein
MEVTMHRNNIEFEVIVGKRSITEYAHEGKTYVEGREGSEFAIRIRNHSGDRVEAVVSVDGLSIVNGKPASEASQGFLIEPHGMTTIPGWMLDHDTAAKFVFSGKNTSYAEQVTGSNANTGVIGVMVFDEKPVRPSFSTTTLQSTNTAGYQPARPTSANTVGYQPITYSAMSVPSKSAVGSVSRSSGSTSQYIGTGFGNDTGFSTKEVEFKRGDMRTMMVMYYDNARGLKKRGIKLIKGTDTRLSSDPDPFPASKFCQRP